MTREQLLWKKDGVMPNPLIEIHNDLINQIFNDHEAQLKAKGEEIEREHNLNLVLLNAFANEEIKKKSKARSIVSMLFWEWRKAKTHQKAMYFSDAFKKAYKILKEQQ